jgi:EAL domain-containing protein (putative c-di-GMP-specific phosphodiesterase class I)
LQACRDAGCHIAIDDFGIGYSSLSYLHYFPINMLKIDKAFVQDMCHDSSAYVLIKSIIALGQSLNMAVVGEGVETADEAGQLAALGCDGGQGFYYTRPIPAGELEAYLQCSADTAPS